MLPDSLRPMPGSPCQMSLFWSPPPSPLQVHNAGSKYRVIVPSLPPPPPHPVLIISPSPHQVHNEGGKHRVIVTKDLPGERWLQILTQADCRVEVSITCRVQPCATRCTCAAHAGLR